MLKIAALTPLLLLAACDAEVKSPASGDETVQMKADADGRVAFNLPFAKGEIKLPAGIMSNTDFDIDGVKMMPGAKVTGFTVDAGNDKPAKVNFTFSAPASPAEVRTYFLDQFREQGVQAALAGDVIQGQTREGDKFQLRLTPQGSGTDGIIELNQKS